MDPWPDHYDHGNSWETAFQKWMQKHGGGIGEMLVCKLRDGFQAGWEAKARQQQEQRDKQRREKY